MPDQFLTTMLLEDKGERANLACSGAGKDPTCLLLGDKPQSPGAACACALP